MQPLGLVWGISGRFITYFYRIIGLIVNISVYLHA
jgi:hypothetical protein